MGTLIGDCDRWLFDSVAQEVNKLAGTTAKIYIFEQMDSTRDALWDEEVEPVYRKNDKGEYGIDCPAYFEAPDRSSVTGEEGYRTDKTSQIQFAQADLEARGISTLQPGDIVLLWTNQYYDIIEPHKKEGYINDSPLNSMVIFDITRRTKNLPESLWIRDL